VSSVWETRYRLLVETLENIVERLHNEEVRTASAESTEQTLRVLMGVITLLKQHRVNKHGQCRYCGWTRWYWQFWRRRPQCTVFRSLNFVLRQPVEVVVQLQSDSVGGIGVVQPERLERKRLDE
jgi:hypothetical protein